MDKGAKSFPLEPWNSNLKQLLSELTQLNLTENDSLTESKHLQKSETSTNISTTGEKPESYLKPELKSQSNLTENDSLTESKHLSEIETSTNIFTTGEKPESYLKPESKS
ncbi:MAG: hypothetical protein WBA93_30980, partial [Microcoleaceae cyanobacterium]